MNVFNVKNLFNLPLRGEVGVGASLWPAPYIPLLSSM